MKRDAIINGISMGSLGWLRESISFPPVQSQTETTTVPGRNSPIRFSVVNNRISYQPRTFQIVLTMLADRERFMSKVSELSQYFAGVLSEVIISEFPDLYAFGTLQLECSYDVQTHKGSVTISCKDADSFLHHKDLTVVKVSGTQTVILKNDFMPVVPEIQCSADTHLEWFIGTDQFDKDLTKGTWTLPELELRQKENSVKIITDGEVTFTYREGCL